MRGMLIAAVFVFAAVFAGDACVALEHVTIRRDDQQTHLSGRLVVEAQDGGLLLLTRDGVMHPIQPDEIVKRKQDDEPFAPLDADALGKQLLADLPKGFETYRTTHYLICYDTSREYAAWCGALFERLHKAFTNFWTRKGIALHEPELPLVAIVFADRNAYVNYTKRDLGEHAASIVGYYNMQTNFITMYDLTGIESLRLPGSGRSSAAQINRMLAQPQAEQTVATIVHEATHQIAFNTGLQNRFADIPLWISEGLAVYFETPDLQSSKGWRSIGAVNHPRLDRFREYQANRQTDSLKSLIADDKRFRDPRQALDAYAEAWALNYYLLNQKPKQYLRYLQLLATKTAMMPDDPETRLADFQNSLGSEIKELDAGFSRYLQKLK